MARAIRMPILSDGRPLYAAGEEIPRPLTMAQVQARIQTMEEGIIYREARRLRPEIERRDGKSCRLCGETDALVVDHVVAVRVGGKSELSNLQLLCKSCNRKKGSRDWGEVQVEALRGANRG